MKQPSLNQASTHFLRLAVVGMTGVLLLFSGWITWLVFHGWVSEVPEFSSMHYPMTVVFGLTIIPFIVAAYQAFKLLGYIDKNKIFTKAAVGALKNIKYCALALS